MAKADKTKLVADNYTGLAMADFIQAKDTSSAGALLEMGDLPLTTPEGYVNGLAAAAMVNFYQAAEEGRDAFQATVAGNRMLNIANESRKAIKNAKIEDILNSEPYKGVIKNKQLLQNILESVGSLTYESVQKKNAEYGIEQQRAKLDYNAALLKAGEDKDKQKAATEAYQETVEKLEKKHEKIANAYDVLNQVMTARHGLTKPNVSLRKTNGLGYTNKKLEDLAKVPPKVSLDEI